MDEYEYNLFVTNPLGESVIRAAIQALQFPIESSGLDAGCGVGFQALDYILDQPDYYACYAYSMFRGLVAD